MAYAVRAEKRFSKNPAAGFKDIQEAIRLAPDDRDVLNTRLRIYVYDAFTAYKAGQNEAAATKFAALEKIDPAKEYADWIAAAKTGAIKLDGNVFALAVPGKAPGTTDQLTLEFKNGGIETTRKSGK